MSNTILLTHFDSLANLICDMGALSNGLRAEAELDGLVIAKEDSVALAEQHLTEPEYEETVAAATIVAFTLHAAKLYPKVLELLCGENEEFRTGTKLGLRLSNIGPVAKELYERAKRTGLDGRLAILDVLSFHRVPLPGNLRELLDIDEPESRSLLLECLGRSKEFELVAAFYQDTDPKVRKMFWRGMALSGHPQIADLCRRSAVRDQPSYDAIRFLGVIATEQDRGLLRKLSSHVGTAVPAIQAMGACGAAELLPDILKALQNPLTADAAANALERITGRGVPRSDPPPPPEHLTEDELDFWSHPGDPIAEVVYEWWKQNHYYFQTGQRYQAGRSVSNDPLGQGFDELPPAIRRDLYLRERALNSNSTPDWELETWPRYQRNPCWGR